jgi:hypothetical protein
MQELKPIFMFIQKISVVFSFESKRRLWKLQHLAKKFWCKGNWRMIFVEGKSPCGQVDLLLRARLLTLKTKDAYHGH